MPFLPPFLPVKFMFSTSVAEAQLVLKPAAPLPRLGEAWPNTLERQGAVGHTLSLRWQKCSPAKGEVPKKKMNRARTARNGLIWRNIGISPFCSPAGGKLARIIANYLSLAESIHKTSWAASFDSTYARFRHVFELLLKH
jgi:hypothetical protein